MKPTREIVIREYLPGDYEADIDGRTYYNLDFGGLFDLMRDSYSYGSGSPVIGYNSGHERPWGDENAD